MHFSLVLATVGRTAELYRLCDSLCGQTHRDFDVVIVDQNPDQRVRELIHAYHGRLETTHIRVPRMGHAGANNVGLAEARGDGIVFPDDDCWYPADLLARLDTRFREHPEWGAIIGRDPTGKWDPRPGPVTRHNAWRRHISFTMFYRRTLIAGERFDESLGVGAGTRWGSGEESDYLLRVLERGTVYYDPALVVYHPAWAAAPYAAPVRRKAHAYALGMGHVLRRHRYPLYFVAYHCLRPAAGVLSAAATGRLAKARYHWAIFLGRAAGWMADPGPRPAAGAAAESATRGEDVSPPPSALSGLLRSAASLYGIQICRKLLPLISVPYLARVLQPAGWGRVAFVQAFGEILATGVEFGFNLSATREVARERLTPARCREVAGGVLGAQALLATAAVLAAVALAMVVPAWREHPRLWAAGLLYGVVQGLTPLWFFQGVERMGTAAALELAGKLTGVAGIFLLVHSPADDWRVLALQAVPAALSAVVGLGLLHRWVGLSRPRWPQVRAALASGWRLFLFRGGVNLYGAINCFLLGLVAPAAVVGYYGCAEKISKAAAGLLSPIREALYPRLSHLVHRDSADAGRLARAGSILSTAAGVGLGVAVLLGAPWIVTTLMGPGFGPAIPVLRILAVLPLVIAITDSVGLQYLLPRGRDALVNRIVFSGGILHLALAVVLARKFGALGMATSVVVAETSIALWMSLAVWNSRTASKTMSLLPPEPAVRGAGEMV